MNKIIRKTLIFLLASIGWLNVSFANEIIKQLDRRMEETNSVVCVGLDPDPNKIPLAILNLDGTIEEKIYLFLTKVIDITAPHVCSYKIQKAFFDQFDAGHVLLKKTCAYIHEKHPGICAFIDCKIGDTDNTMQAYMHLLFDKIKADGIVINPYMGDDVLEPFLKDSKKVAIVLIQTSNPNAKIIQEMNVENGKKLWESILDIALNRWNQNNNLILVLSSNTAMDNYESVRKIIPQDMPILLAGIGSQGGNPKVMKQLLNENKRGVFVNSSRGILYPYHPAEVNWEKEVLQAVLNLKQELNQIRSGN